MKRFIKIGLVAALLAVFSTGCVSPSKVDAGEEGVMVKKPWIVGHGGVDPSPIKTGLEWTAFSTEVVRVNVKPFNIDETYDDLVTSDNNPVDFKIHLTFKHIEGQTPVLVEKFGNGWYSSKIREPFRNSVRDFTKSKTMFEMTTNAKVTTELEDKVKAEIRAFIKQEGIPTELVNLTVGKVMPPKAVVDATIQTAVQKQNVKTQNERVKAEEARENAEKASARADKAYMTAINMTPDQYLKMKELDNQKLAIEKGSNVSIIMGSATPMFSVGK